MKTQSTPFERAESLSLRLCVAIRPSEREILDTLAAERGLSISSVVRSALLRELERLSTEALREAA